MTRDGVGSNSPQPATNPEGVAQTQQLGEDRPALCCRVFGGDKRLAFVLIDGALMVHFSIEGVPAAAVFKVAASQVEDAIAELAAIDPVTGQLAARLLAAPPVRFETQGTIARLNHPSPSWLTLVPRFEGPGCINALWLTICAARQELERCAARQELERHAPA